MIETLSFKANEKSIDLVFNLDPMLPRVLSGDSLRIKQVLTTLSATRSNSPTEADTFI